MQGTCDECGETADVIPCGADAEGAPDAPDLCEACRNGLAVLSYTATEQDVDDVAH